MNEDGENERFKYVGAHKNHVRNFLIFYLRELGFTTSKLSRVFKMSKQNVSKIVKRTQTNVKNGYYESIKDHLDISRPPAIPEDNDLRKTRYKHEKQ